MKTKKGLNDMGGIKRWMLKKENATKIYQLKL